MMWMVGMAVNNGHIMLLTNIIHAPCRELLNRLEVFVRQVRQCSSAACSTPSPALSPAHSAAAAQHDSLEDRILPQLELLLQQIMQLVNR